MKITPSLFDLIGATATGSGGRQEYDMQADFPRLNELQPVGIRQGPTIRNATPPNLRPRAPGMPPLNTPPPGYLNRCNKLLHRGVLHHGSHNLRVTHHVSHNPRVSHHNHNPMQITMLQNRISHPIGKFPC